MIRAGLIVLLLSLGAHPSLQCYFQTTLKDAAYQRKVFDKVSARWKPPREKPEVGKKAVVQAVLRKDGTLESAVVSMESGAKAWDDAALQAVKRAAPFPALPKDFAQDTVQAHFHVGWER